MLVRNKKINTVVAGIVPINCAYASKSELIPDIYIQNKMYCFTDGTKHARVIPFNLYNFGSSFKILPFFVFKVSPPKGHLV